MIRLLKRLTIFRKLALRQCSVYQKKEPTCLKNVVNCRACYLLVNAIDYIVYQRLALIFDLTEHAFSFSIYKFKLQQMYHENKRNKYKMHQDVFQNIWRHLNLYTVFRTALSTKQSDLRTHVDNKSCLKSVYCVDTFVPCYNFCQIQRYENAKRVKKESMCAESETKCKIGNEFQSDQTQQ